MPLIRLSLIWGKPRAHIRALPDGVHRTDDLVMVYVVAGDWRDAAQKTLCRAITDNLVAAPGLRPEDVLIVLSPDKRDDWSFGNGLAS